MTHSQDFLAETCAGRASHEPQAGPEITMIIGSDLEPLVWWGFCPGT